MPANVSPLNPIGFLTPFGPRELNEIPLDVVVEERVDHSIVVTRHPIEVAAGSTVTRGTVSDNAYLEPIIYTMRGAVSDFPISWRLFDNRYANGSGETRSLSAYGLLRDHFKTMTPFALKTPFGFFENMLFRRFTVPRDQDTKHAIIFRAEMIELQIVVPNLITSAKTEAEVTGDQAEAQAISERDRGDVTPPSV